MSTFDKDKIISVLYSKNLNLSAEKYFEPLSMFEITSISKMYKLETKDKQREQLCEELKNIIDSRNFKIIRKKAKEEVKEEVKEPVKYVIKVPEEVPEEVVETVVEKPQQSSEDEGKGKAIEEKPEKVFDDEQENFFY